MTGLWQVLGRTDIPFEEMVKLDYLYVTNWSLWLDIKLIAAHAACRADPARRELATRFRGGTRASRRSVAKQN